MKGLLLIQNVLICTFKIKAGHMCGEDINFVFNNVVQQTITLNGSHSTDQIT